MQYSFFCFLAVALFCNIFANAEEWEDTETTSSLWSAISSFDTAALNSLLNADPANAFLRSKDGRGPIFWAYEFDNKEAISILEEAGADHDLEDVDGKTPKQLAKENVELNKKRKVEREERLEQQRQAAAAYEANLASGDEDGDESTDEDDEDL
jgi:ankyrin repeat protein